AISIAITSTLVFGASAFWFRADNPRHAALARLEEDLRTPVVSDDPAARRGALQVYGLIGHICLLLGAVLALCTFLPGSAVAPSTINLVAGILLITLGLALRRFATRPDPTSFSPGQTGTRNSPRSRPPDSAPQRSARRRKRWYSMSCAGRTGFAI